MKIPFFFIAILTTVAAFGLPTSAQANPPVQQQVVAITSQPTNGAAAKKNANRVPVNMGNYWDAKQWDREGGASFWHATSETKKRATGQRVTKNAKKGGRFVKKLFNR